MSTAAAQVSDTGDALAAARARLVVALDLDDLHEALRLVDRLSGEVGMFKIGKQMFLHAGPQVVRDIRARGGEVFLDMKLHDIPVTVAKASIEAARMGVRIFNVHAAGGREMMRMSVEAVDRVCREEGLRRPVMLAVTVLTSLNNDDLRSVGVNAPVGEHVVRLAKLAQDAGVDGVVASAQEIDLLRRECGPSFVLLTPGIRPAGSDVGDQKRVLTPMEAIAKGSDYLVVGRPIVEASDPVAMARRIVGEMAEGLAARSHGA